MHIRKGAIWLTNRGTRAPPLTVCLRWQVRELEAQVEDASSAAARAVREAAAAVEAERAVLAEARRENAVLAAAAGAEKNSALADLKVRTRVLPAVGTLAWSHA